MYLFLCSSTQKSGDLLYTTHTQLFQVGEIKIPTLSDKIVTLPRLIFFFSNLNELKKKRNKLKQSLSPPDEKTEPTAPLSIKMQTHSEQPSPFFMLNIA